MAGIKLEKLWTPISIGNVKVPNRLVMPALGTGLCREQGYIDANTIEACEVRAAGGIGLMIVESTWIHRRDGNAFKGLPILDDDSYIPGMRQLADHIKGRNVRVFIQINHAGAETHVDYATVPKSSSEYVLRDGRKTRAMTKTEIAEVIEMYVQTALRAKKAGFEGVELHAAHGFLFAQFLSPSFNVRQDKYGGSLQNRARLLLDTIKAIKKAAGSDFPVIVRLNGIEWKKNGQTNEETVQVARWCEEAGADALNITGYAVDHEGIWRSLPTKEGVILPFAAAVKKAAKVPVIVVGLLTPEMGEQAIRDGMTDLVAIGRGLVADPELIVKSKEGRHEDIRPCIRCMLCLYEIISSRPRQCSVNPTDCKELQSVIIKADKPKKVVVVGGGPAGMEAARVAALKGHQVTLYEKGGRLGGQLNVARIPIGKEQIGRLAEYYETQLKKLKVKVQLGKAVTPAMLQKAKPDAVVLATGMTRCVPDIPGLSQTQFLFPEDVLIGKAAPGARVLVIGGGLAGCETAAFLAEQGRTVTLCEMLPQVMAKEIPPRRDMALFRLTRLNVRIVTSGKVAQVATGKVTVARDGQSEEVPVDDIVVAVSPAANRELSEALKGWQVPAYTIGDCQEPRRIKEAVEEGFKVAMRL